MVSIILHYGVIYPYLVEVSSKIPVAVLFEPLSIVYLCHISNSAIIMKIQLLNQVLLTLHFHLDQLAKKYLHLLKYIHQTLSRTQISSPMIVLAPQYQPQSGTLQCTGNALLRRTLDKIY